jgi:hypothetical protein
MGKWIIWSFIYLPYLCPGQNKIYGVVSDFSSKAPLEFENVFINNTTIGTT